MGVAGAGENFDCETMKVTWSPIRPSRTFNLLYLEIEFNH